MMRGKQLAGIGYEVYRNFAEMRSGHSLPKWGDARGAFRLWLGEFADHACSLDVEEAHARTVLENPAFYPEKFAELSAESQLILRLVHVNARVVADFLGGVVAIDPAPAPLNGEAAVDPAPAPLNGVAKKRPRKK